MIRRLIFKILAVSTIAALLLVGITLLVQKGYSKYFSHQTDRFAELLNGKVNYDVLFLGSSRTHVDINPRIVDSITGLNTYNFGLEGANLLETKLWADAYLAAHKPPKTMVIDITSHSLSVDQNPFANFQYYLPYLNSPVIYNTLSKYHNMAKYRYFLPMQLTLLDDYQKANALKGLAGKKDEHSTAPNYKGFYEIGADVIKPVDVAYPEPITYSMNPAGQEFLKSWIVEQRSKGIKMVFIIAPVLPGGIYTNDADFTGFFQDLAKNTGCAFIDYRNSSLFNDQLFFYNKGHLNAAGNRLFSAVLSNDILKALSVQQ